MSILPNAKSKTRKAAKIAPLQAEFQGAIQALLAKFKRSGGFNHRLSKGMQRERDLVAELFSRTFPKTYAFASGEVHDSRGENTGQLDVIIYNHLRHFALYADHLTILPAEAPLCGIEVKSNLDRAALEDALRAAQKLKQLKPFGAAISDVRKHGEPADEKLRYFYVLFAFKTMHEGKAWAQEIANALSELSRANGIPLGHLDRIYAPGCGMLIPDDGYGGCKFFPETIEDGDALFSLYLDVLNFCNREEKRRPTSSLVPRNAYHPQSGK